MDAVTRQAVGETARVGSDTPQDASGGLDQYVKGQARDRRTSGWK